MTIEIHRIAVPNPFFEGRNSVYLLKGDPITLVDTGVATTKAYDVLCEGLQKHDVAITDIKRVLLTHKHIDHIGNAWRVQQQAGADVYIHTLETKSLTQVDPTGRRFDKLVSDRLQQWKAPLPDPNPDSSDKMPEWELQSCEPIALNDGDELTIDDEPIQVIHTPGHSMGSVCYHVADHFFSGDHVLRAISPNVGAGDLRSSGLLGRFLNSLDRIGHLGEVRIIPDTEAHSTDSRTAVRPFANTTRIDSTRF